MGWEVQISDPITFSPLRNVFWNKMLFDIYSGYLINTLVGMANQVFPDFPNSLPPFLPVNDTNRIEQSPAYILTSYQCSQLAWKGWASALFSIAISSLWTGGYTIFLIFVNWIQE